MRTFLTDVRGGPALELVLLFPVFVLLVVGIFSVALLLWTENSIQFAAEAAARCASIDLNHCDSVTAVQDEVIQRELLEMAKRYERLASYAANRRDTKGQNSGHD